MGACLTAVGRDATWPRPCLLPVRLWRASEVFTAVHLGVTQLIVPSPGCGCGRYVSTEVSDAAAAQKRALSGFGTARTAKSLCGPIFPSSLLEVSVKAFLFLGSEPSGWGPGCGSEALQRPGRRLKAQISQAQGRNERRNLKNVSFSSTFACFMALINNCSLAWRR